MTRKFLLQKQKDNKKMHKFKFNCLKLALNLNKSQYLMVNGNKEF